MILREFLKDMTHVLKVNPEKRLPFIIQNIAYTLNVVVRKKFH